MLVLQVSKRQTNNKEDYYDLLVGNRFGKAPIKIWEITKPVAEGNFIELTGKGAEHKTYGKQWKIDSYNVVSYGGDPDFDRLVYVPDVDKLFNTMVTYPYKNYTVQCLLKKFLADKELVELYKTVPASTANHHNYKGGLTQHCYEVWSMTECLLAQISAFQCYQSPQTDVAMFAAFIHDISKCYEYSSDGNGGWKKSNMSVLIGNPSYGFGIMYKMAKDLEKEGIVLDQTVLDLIFHINISHHTRPEYGSPVAPLCLEALAVASADAFSANASHILMATELKDDPDSNFTKNYFFFNNHSVFKVPVLNQDYGRP